MTRPSEAQQHSNGYFLPDFCSIRITFAVVIAAELLAVVLSIAGFTSLQSFWSNLSMLSLYIQWVALGSSASLCLLKPLLRKLNAGSSGVAALMVLLIFTGLVAHISHALVANDYNGPGYQAFMLQSLAVSFIIGVLSLHYFYMQFRLGQQQQAEAEAKFQALQARIRPHFLFNSMNTIAHLTRADPEMAENVVENLADLFRATLGDPDKPSTLEQEIELAKGYLNIESMRLGNRLRVQWQLDDSLMAVSMPAMMLQPLLENAVYHGIEPSAEGGEIQVKAKRDNGTIQLQISNTLADSAQPMQRKGNKMAQLNTRQRLLSVYGDKASFEAKHYHNLYLVRMKFPIEKP